MDQSRPTIPFAWSVAAASFAILFVSAGARLMIGVVQKPITAEFGWSRGEFSAAVFVNTAMLTLSIAVAGLLCDRFGSKWAFSHPAPCSPAA
jgi:hypothetical protein